MTRSPFLRSPGFLMALLSFALLAAIFLATGQPPTLEAGVMASVAPAFIQPSVGRRLWYWPSEEDITGESQTDALRVFDRTQPLDAGVAYVWNDRMVNLSVADQAGRTHGRTSVLLLQGEDARPQVGSIAFAEWMDYQKAQATGGTRSDAPQPSTSTVVYTDGTTATGTPPLPDQSPVEAVG